VYSSEIVPSVQALAPQKADLPAPWQVAASSDAMTLKQACPVVGADQTVRLRVLGRLVFIAAP
jgi:hypothetical protein